jgi:hypothetical protein
MKVSDLISARGQRLIVSVREGSSVADGACAHRHPRYAAPRIGDRDFHMSLDVISRAL